MIIMDYPSIHSLKIATMVTIVPLNGMINLKVCFIVLPVQHIEIKHKGKKKPKKIKLPISDISGSILSMATDDLKRGIIKTDKRAWKNAISIDISIPGHNVNMKLCKSKIQVAGAKALDDGYVSSNYIFEKLLKINAEMEYIRSIENIKDVMEKLKDATKGDFYIDDDVYNILDVEKLYEVTKFDQTLQSFLCRNASEYERHDVFWNTHESLIFSGTMCCSSDIEISKVLAAMTNINYDLGIEINMDVCAMLLNEEGYCVIYDNKYSRPKFIKIEIPYMRESTSDMKKGKVIACHTIMIFKTGKVTQSGPTIELMEPIYNDVREFVIRNREKIRVIKEEQFDIIL